MRTVKPATVLSASFVMANLRAEDHTEVFCQLPEGTPAHAVAYQLVFGGAAFTAFIDDQPVAIFGTSPINCCCLSVWALGTERLPRVAGTISTYLLDEHLPQRVEAGFTSMEARPLAGNELVHRWLLGLGAMQHGEPFVYGRGGERFVLFRWTVAEYRAMRAKHLGRRAA